MFFSNMIVMMVCLLIGISTAYDEIAVTDGGTIKGIVKKTGEIPKDEMLTVTADAEFCGDKIAAEKYVISPEGKIKWAVVYLSEISSGKPVSKDPVVIDNVECRYEPHVAVAPVGGDLQVLNSDPLSNTAHFYLQMGKKRKTIINISLPKQGMVGKNPKILRRPGILSLECDVHDFEQGWVMSLPHPYAAVTDKDGQFEIDNIPPGEYTLKTWHEALGEKETKVKITAGKTVTLNFEY